MTEDESLVRSVWTHCALKLVNGIYDKRYYVDAFKGGIISGEDVDFATRSEAWAAAAQYTRLRREQVEQLEEEIRRVAIEKSLTQIDTRKRVLDRLRTELAELRKGMK